MTDPSPSWVPTLAAIGAQLRARTRVPGGEQLGTFTTETRPTAVEVTALRDAVLPEVLLRIPDVDTLPTRLKNAATQLAILRTAMAIELSYNPERTDEGTSYANFRDLYAQGLTAFLAAADVIAADDTPAVPAVL